MTFGTATIIDLCAVGIIVLFTVRGYKRGLIKTVAGLLALVLAFYGAGFVAKQFTPAVSASYTQQYIRKIVTNEVGQQIGQAVPDEQAPGVEEEQAEPQEEVPQSKSWMPQAISKVVDDAVAEFKQTGQLAVDAGIAKASDTITYAALFVLAFIALLIILKLVIWALDLAAKMPVVKTVNKFGGVIIGLVIGYIIVLLAAYILLNFTGVINHEQVSQTVLMRFMFDSFGQFAVAKV